MYFFEEPLKVKLRMANKYLNTALFDKALIFATKAHANIERRGKAYPYIVHPMEAVAIVATITNDPELLAATVLHDVIEDTDFSEADIRKEFGDRIADLVVCESDIVIENMDESASWKVRKQFAIERLSKANRDAKIVAIGDKLSNLRAIQRDYEVLGERVWELFHAPEPSLYEWRYRALLKAFNGLEDTAPYKEFAELVQKIWG